MPESQTNWKSALDQAVRKAKAKVIGHQKIKEVQHGLLVTTALNAFGDDNRAVFFIEGLSTTGDIPRPDLILLQPDVGVLVIENKGIRLNDINEVENTALKLVRDGRLKEEDPFHQAERVRYRLLDLTALRVRLSEVLFLHTVALPRIEREEFERRFHVRWPDETLFAKVCADPELFKNHVLGFSRCIQQKAMRSCKLSKRAADAVLMILNGESFIYTPRKTYTEETNPSLFGVQIQELELGLKEPTEQQRELGKSDLRGNHRLFRGVAGSGKSIMLALSAAHTLTKYKEEAGLFAAHGPKQRVLVVCFNKTLVHYLRQRIEDRFGRLAWDKPSDDVLTVTHFEGLVRELEEKVPALRTDLDFKQKGKRAAAMCAAFDLLPSTKKETVRYDAVYVDEAQDLLPEEFELLLRLARKNDRGGQTFLVFYDNAQNIYGVPTPVWSSLGINIVGRTEFLDKCLRNTREVLAFAFNVLVGTYAPEGQRVTTRRFADVDGLRQRGLITEKNRRFEIHFSPRTGPSPFVRTYSSRQAEIDGVIEAVRKLIASHRVIPSDILILYNSHYEYEELGPRLEKVIGSDYRVRLVDSRHNANKNYVLVEDGILTVSTIHSSKGYDAPVVFLLGMDQLSTTVNEHRALFYVGATRAKLHLVVTGVKKAEPSLLDEIVLAARDLATVTTIAPPITKPAVSQMAANLGLMSPPKAQKKCRHCKSPRLHAQYGKFGYFFRCIDCTENTPMEMICSKCGKKAKIRKEKNRFFKECEACRHSELYHENVPLDALFEEGE